jgi:hypothetical protein
MTDKSMRTHKRTHKQTPSGHTAAAFTVRHRPDRPGHGRTQDRHKTDVRGTKDIHMYISIYIYIYIYIYLISVCVEGLYTLSSGRSAAGCGLVVKLCTTKLYTKISI